MGCGQCLLNIANVFAMLLGIGLLSLGLKTGLSGLTGLACVVLVIACLGCCGGCCESSWMLIAYSLSMFALSALSAWYLVSPASIKPLVSEQLEELVVASYMQKGSLEDMRCCPRIPLQQAQDAETWVANKFAAAGNQLACAGTRLLGMPSCEEVVDYYLDVHGRAIATFTGLIALMAGSLAMSTAVHKIREKQSSTVYLIRPSSQTA